MLSSIFYAWVALVTPRQPTSTVAPPMGANEAPKHPEKQVESRGRLKEMLKKGTPTPSETMGLPHLNTHGLESLFQSFHRFSMPGWPW